MITSIPLLLGAPAGTSSGAASGSPQGSFVQIAMIVGVFAIFWFLIIRPQRKKQKETKRMLEGIQKGDKVTSIGGIRGTVKTVNENTVIIEVDNKGSTLEFTKSAIGTVDQRKTESPAEPAKPTDEKES